MEVENHRIIKDYSGGKPVFQEAMVHFHVWGEGTGSTFHSNRWELVCTKQEGPVASLVTGSPIFLSLPSLPVQRLVTLL